MANFEKMQNLIDGLIANLDQQIKGLIEKEVMTDKGPIKMQFIREKEKEKDPIKFCEFLEKWPRGFKNFVDTYINIESFEWELTEDQLDQIRNVWVNSRLVDSDLESEFAKLIAMWIESL